VLYRVEFQPMENAILRGLEGGVQRVGFFHSPFGRYYLPLRLAPAELDPPDSGGAAGPRPLPEAVVACGPLARRYLAADGYPVARVALCGPQRHQAFLDFRASLATRAALRDRLQIPQERTIVFVALAIVEEETEALFMALTEACREEINVHVLIKTHPNRPDGDAAMADALHVLGPDRARVLPGSANMYEYMAAADAMLCIGSTIAFEAMAVGVMHIAFEHPGTYAATSLGAFTDALFVARTPEELRAALVAVLERSEPARARQLRWPQTIGEVFGQLDVPLRRQLRDALAALAPIFRTGVRRDGLDPTLTTR
jgi:hypothetical protein